MLLLDPRPTPRYAHRSNSRTHILQSKLGLHQLDGRPRSMYKLLLRPLHGSHGLRAFARILNSDRGKIRTMSLLAGVEHNSSSTRPLPPNPSSSRTLQRVIRPRSGMKSRQRNGKIFRMDFLIRRPLVTHLPTHRRRGRWGDEEQLIALRCLEVLVALLDLCLHAKVDAHSAAENGLAVEDLPDADRVVGGEEGADDASHRLEGGEGVDAGMFVDGAVDRFEIGCCEDFGRLEVGDEECVAWRRRLAESGKIG